MSGVIYADVLVVINFYVTYFLLLSSALLSKENVNRLRLFLSSLFGGLYSLTILIDENHTLFLFFLKVGAAVLPVIIAFGFRSMKSFLRLESAFLLSSFLFAGLMLALWYFVCPEGMYFNGSVVYFDIDILSLVIFTVISYGFMKLFELLFRSRAPVGTSFILRFSFEGEEYELKAFLDTGNRLRDCLTGKSVIVAKRSCFPSFLTDKADEEFLLKHKMRLIVCSTVSGEGVLQAFSAGKISITGTKGELTSDKVLIALTDENILSGEYDAVLPITLFQDTNYGKDEECSDRNNFNFKRNHRENKAEAFSVADFLHKRTGKSACSADKRKRE